MQMKFLNRLKDVLGPDWPTKNLLFLFRRRHWSIAERRRGEGVALREREKSEWHRGRKSGIGKRSGFYTPPLRGRITVSKTLLLFRFDFNFASPLPVSVVVALSMTLLRRNSHDEIPTTTFPRRRSSDGDVSLSSNLFCCFEMFIFSNSSL